MSGSGHENGGSGSAAAVAAGAAGNDASCTATNAEAEMKGWLLKWTNYLKGYQRRWFVLCNGVLSYYR